MVILLVVTDFALRWITCSTVAPRYGFPAGMEDLRRELEDLVNAQSFVPFVVTSNDGFAIAVGSPKRALVGLRMLVVTGESGRLYRLPFAGIAHISEAKAA
jgi:hypothetical protein